ncbi:hypothetical protein QJS83_15265 [Bdellovibrio sp. 22V]|uniref:hypothetical protein n=1 Tax=Bdellovibrio sp. 22V TaxID=3044166 RepID=UPI002542AA27|nr:hypothetical protein [Bdellovibrio sp. 22V]WII71822.1 hypothetical protein QJS83_15265 [Bdellovibrio sp. 22V]
MSADKAIRTNLILLGIIYLVFTFVAFASQNFLVMFSWGGISTLFIFLYLKKSELILLREERTVVTFVTSILLACLLVLPFSVQRSLTNLAYFIYILLIFFVSHFLSKNTNYFYVCFRGSLFLIQMGLISIIILHPASDPLSSLVGGSSANGITSYLIILQACYNALHFHYKRTLPSWAQNFLTLFICYVGFGRGSILASLMLLSINFFYGLAFDKAKRWVYLAVVIFGSFLIVKRFDSILALIMNTNLARGFYDQPRIEMWIDYYRRLTPMDLILGGDFKGSIIGDFYSGNPHNSFIRAHGKFGIVYVILLLASPFVVFLKNKVNRNSLYLLITLLVIFFRAMTEPVLFPTLIDLFYFATLYAIVRINYRNSEQA